ncbi:MAG: peptidoglycan DD-metalloendopeptidase family protein [Parvibaculaceae bacterium]|nr:peptidoglycan DD-metalloendopeptidase family protein [Parvibaculaceae bacterium]
MQDAHAAENAGRADKVTGRDMRANPQGKASHRQNVRSSLLQIRLGFARSLKLYTTASHVVWRSNRTGIVLGIAAAILLAGTGSLMLSPAGGVRTASLATRPAPQILAQATSREDKSATFAARALPERPHTNQPPLAQPVVTTVEIERGDTLMQVLTSAGADEAEATSAIKALQPLFSPRNLKVGQEISLTLEPRPSASNDPSTGPLLQLASVSFEPDLSRKIEINRDSGGTFRGTAIEKPLTDGLSRAQGTISQSLYLSAQRQGVPAPVLAEFIRIFSYDVDFQRDLKPGDRFELLFQRQFDEQGIAVRDGNILYASLTIDGKPHRLWRFSSNGDVDYFDERGQSMKKFLMKTPIDGARISSSFGMRKHPILGYSKMHTGVDFAAPRGTPIYAAGDGVVTRASWFSGYGNYVEIRHSNGYATAYGHMSGYARGLRAGSRVRQGQIIGYVGTTGRSTGPHLHYEVHLRNKKINPLGVNVPTGVELASRDMKKFASARAGIATQYAEAPLLSNLARATSPAADSAD